MTVAVVSIPDNPTMEPLRHALFALTGREAVGGGRVYLFYSVHDDERTDSRYAFGGKLLVESRSFPTLAAADAWVRADVATRVAIANAVTRGRAS